MLGVIISLLRKAADIPGKFKLIYFITFNAYNNAIYNEF